MYMGGVDLADFRCAVNERSWKSPNWRHQIFFGLIDRTLGNSFVVFKKLTHKNITMLTYRRHVMQSLITLTKPPKVGRLISNTTASASPSVSERYTSNYLSAKVSVLKIWYVIVVAQTKSSQVHKINDLYYLWCFSMLQ